MLPVASSGIRINERAVPNLDSLLAIPPDDAANAEIRQLKMTSAALRQALEQGAMAREEFSRTLHAARESEISQLKATSRRCARSSSR